MTVRKTISPDGPARWLSFSYLLGGPFHLAGNYIDELLVPPGYIFILCGGFDPIIVGDRLQIWGKKTTRCRELRSDLGRGSIAIENRAVPAKCPVATWLPQKAECHPKDEFAADVIR